MLMIRLGLTGRLACTHSPGRMVSLVATSTSRKLAGDVRRRHTNALVGESALVVSL